MNDESNESYHQNLIYICAFNLINNQPSYLITTILNIGVTFISMSIVVTALDMYFFSQDLVVILNDFCNIYIELT